MGTNIVVSSIDICSGFLRHCIDICGSSKQILYSFTGTENSKMLITNNTPYDNERALFCIKLLSLLVGL